MMNFRRAASLFIVAGTTGLALGNIARAGTSTADFQSNASLHQLGSFAGTMSYDDAAHKLTITLDNTSAAGKLTGFAFDIVGADTAKLEAVKKDPWKDDRNKKGIVVAKPYGNFEAGAGLAGKFGTNGAKGIAAGSSKTFIFDVTGATAGQLTARDFLTQDAGHGIVASFAKFKKGKTDRASGVLTSSSLTTSNVFGNLIPNNVDGTGALSGDGASGTGNPINNGDGGKTPSGGTGGSNAAAVPLPSAAAGGLFTLALLTIAACVRRAGRRTA